MRPKPWKIKGYKQHRAEPRPQHEQVVPWAGVLEEWEDSFPQFCPRGAPGQVASTAPAPGLAEVLGVITLHGSVRKERTRFSWSAVLP